MLQFVFAIVGAAAFCVLYIVGRMARTILAAADGNPGPRERVGPYLLFAACFGAVAGWLAFEPYMIVEACQAAGEHVITCALFPKP